jgi:hyperosmotically inducible periplasmic protein
MNRKLFIALACALALGACKQKGDEDQGSTQTTGANVRSDNTKLNERDRSGATALPRDQSNATEDLDVTARLRKSLVANKGLSMDAKNVKIITRDGNVTLRGVVKDDQEKQTIQDEAQRVQGVKNVENQLDVLNR